MRLRQRHPEDKAAPQERRLPGISTRYNPGLTRPTLDGLKRDGPTPSHPPLNRTSYAGTIITVDC